MCKEARSEYVHKDVYLYMLYLPVFARQRLSHWTPEIEAAVRGTAQVEHRQRTGSLLWKGPGVRQCGRELKGSRGWSMPADGFPKFQSRGRFHVFAWSLRHQLPVWCLRFTFILWIWCITWPTAVCIQCIRHSLTWSWCRPRCCNVLVRLPIQKNDRRAACFWGFCHPHKWQPHLAGLGALQLKLVGHSWSLQVVSLLEKYFRGRFSNC